VPQGTDLLVVAGPRGNFVEPELDALGRYLDRGGRMLVLADPELDAQGGLISIGLERWLAERGVAMGDNLVVDPSSTLPFFGAETIFVRGVGTSPVVESLVQAELPVIFALSRSVGLGTVPATMQGSTLLETSAEGWGEVDLANLRGVEKGASDLAGPVPLGVAIAPKKSADSPGHDELEEEMLEEPEPGETAATEKPGEQGPDWRLVVLGDSDFLRNGHLRSVVGNPTLASNAFNWLLERQKLLGIGPKKPEQARLTLTPGQLSAITWLVLGGLPLLAVAAGVTTHFRRRR
jgi:hypothetical protein